MYTFDTTTAACPYGTWIDVDTGQKTYYDRDGVFYDNTVEIASHLKTLAAQDINK